MQRLKLLIVTALLLTSSVAFAFGGGGGKKEMFEEEWAKGVDSFGLYFGGKGQADIKFSCSGLHQAPNNKGVCDCIKGYKKRNDVCVKDACEGFDPTANECITACTDVNGVATYTYPKTCKNGQWACNANHKCENPCYDIECYTCTVDSQGNPSWDKKANKDSCSTGWCQGGDCVNACADKTWDDECQTCDIHTGKITPSEIDGTPCSKGSCQSGTCTDMCEDKTLGQCDLSCDSKTGKITPKDAHTGCYLSNESVIAPGTPTDGVCDGKGNCIECIDSRDCKGSEICGTDHKCINACAQELEAYDSVGIVSSSDDKVVYSTQSCKQYIAENNKCTEQKLGSGSCSTEEGASGTCSAEGNCIVPTCTSSDQSQCKGIEKCGSNNTCVHACYGLTGDIEVWRLPGSGDDDEETIIWDCKKYEVKNHTCTITNLNSGVCKLESGKTGMCSNGTCTSFTCTDDNQCYGYQKCDTSTGDCIWACGSDTDSMTGMILWGGVESEDTTWSYTYNCKEYTIKNHTCSTENLSGGSCTMADGTTKGVCSVGNCVNPCDLKEDKESCKKYKPSTDGTECVEDGNKDKGTQNCDADHTNFVCNGAGKCTCPEGQFPVHGTFCTDCNKLESSIINSSDEDVCTACTPSRSIFRSDVYIFCGLTECPNDTIRGQYGECHQCSSPENIETNQDECQKCGNDRQYNTTTEMCEYCPNGVCPEHSTCTSDDDCPDHNWCQEGQCVACFTYRPHENPTACTNKCGYEMGEYYCTPECEENNECDDGKICSEGFCVNPCDLKTDKDPCKTYKVEGTSCVEDGNKDKGTQNCDPNHTNYVCNGAGKCTCPEGQFPRLDGACTTCNNQASWQSTEELCAACDDTETPRKIYPYKDTDYCVLSTCPSGTFRHVNGDCSNCSGTDGYVTSSEECAACNDTETPRKMWPYNGTDYCVLNACPSGRFRNENGNCSLCSYDASYATSAAECATCDNTDYPRFLSSDNKCYVCTRSDSVATTRGACLKCSQRTYNADTGNCELCDGECPACSADNYTDCHKAECEKLGSGYTYSETDGCQPTQQKCTTTTDCTGENQICDTASGECVCQNGWFSDYNQNCKNCAVSETTAFAGVSASECQKCASYATYNWIQSSTSSSDPTPLGTCTLTPPTCNEQTYHGCDEEACLALNGDTDKVFKFYEGQEGQAGQCIRCDKDSYAECNETDCNALRSGSYKYFAGEGCLACSVEHLKACGYNECEALGYQYVTDTEHPENMVCGKCESVSDCRCCQSCKDTGQCVMDIDHHQYETCPYSNDENAVLKCDPEQTTPVVECKTCYRYDMFKQKCVETTEDDRCAGTCQAGTCVTDCDPGEILDSTTFDTPTCVSCDSYGEIITTESACNTCPQRLWNSQNNKCTRACYNEGDSCICPNGALRSDYGGPCTSCDQKSAITSITEDECNRCSQRSYIDGRCILTVCPDGYLHDNLGYCKPCNHEYAISGISQSECSRCPTQRWFDDQSNRCVMVDCPSGSYFSYYFGRCEECTEAEPETEAECKQCSNRRWNGGYDECALCSSDNCSDPIPCSTEHLTSCSHDECRRLGPEYSYKKISGEYYCRKDASIQSCTSSSTCNTNEYCMFKQTAGQSSCISTENGTCQSILRIDTDIYSGNNSSTWDMDWAEPSDNVGELVNALSHWHKLTIGATTYTIAYTLTGLSYDNAQSWCASQGLSLVSYSEFQSIKSQLDTLATDITAKNSSQYITECTYPGETDDDDLEDAPAGFALLCKAKFGGLLFSDGLWQISGTNWGTEVPVFSSMTEHTCHTELLAVPLCK